MAISATAPAPDHMARLVASCGVIFIVAIGLAFAQVWKTRQLGPEQQIPGTPLHVRLPKDFQPVRDQPGRFRLQPQSADAKEFPLRRVVEFDYRRLRPREDVAKLLSPVARETARPAKIGAFDAVELRDLREIRPFGRVMLQESVLRYATMPDGNVVTIQYWPMLEMQSTDEALLEEIAATVRVEDDADPPRVDPLTVLGAELPLESDWRIMPYERDGIPAAYVVGLTDGMPGWSIALFRTWLAESRTPTALLQDLAADAWLLAPEAQRFESSTRGDGAAVVALHHPHSGSAEPPSAPLLCAAWVLAESPRECVIGMVYARAESWPAAGAAADKIAATLALREIEAIPDLAEASAAARELVAMLHQRGAMPRWGADRMMTAYRRAERDTHIDRVASRAPIDGDPERGYRGEMRRRRRGADDREIWVIDGRARAYTEHRELVIGGTAIVRDEERRADGKITRRIVMDGVAWPEQMFEPGPAFVPPPVEEVIYGWVARGESPIALIDAASLLGPKTHTELVRTLPGVQSRTRVRVQVDYWPAGQDLEFNDSTAELVAIETTDERFERIEP